MAKDPTQGMNAAPDDAAGGGQSEIQELRRRVDELSGKYGSMAQNTFSDVKESVSQSMGDIEKQIREKPVQAAVIAAVTGFLIGALLTR